MASLNNPVCWLDSDVLINWLAKEVDPITKTPLWESPLEIVKLIESDAVNGWSSVMILMEVRFVLRRKKNLSEEKIKEYISLIMEIVKIIVPDEISILKADNLQSSKSLSPFDAIFLATGLLSAPNAILVSRDKELLKTASGLLSAFTPEDFLSHIKR